jgi:pimeloyl-ACP methyl ester carboxylesterase
VTDLSTNGLAAAARNSCSRLQLAGLLACAGLLASCAAQSSPSASPSAESTATASPSPIASTPATVVYQGVAISSDRELLVKCVGSGAPTILLEAGGTTSNLQEWPSTFVTKLAKTTTTCLYSRAGGNGSTPVAGLLTRQIVVDDAFTLLDVLHRDYGVSGPYLLVGWSFGGSVVLAEALEHPELTVGLVILDTGFPADFLKVCPLSGRSKEECQAEYAGDEEAKSIEKQIVDRLHPLPDLPVSIVSAMQLPDCSVAPGATSVTTDVSGVLLTAPDCDALASLIADKELNDWRQLGPQVTQTRVEADHDGLINEAMQQIVGIVLGVLTSR